MSSKTQVSKVLPDSISDCHEALVEGERKLKALEAELAWFRNRVFGQKRDNVRPFGAEQQGAFASLHDVPAKDSNPSDEPEV